MIAKIRLYNNADYAEHFFNFPGSNIADVGERIHAFCMGYQLGTGNKALVIAVTNARSGDPLFEIEWRSLKELRK